MSPRKALGLFSLVALVWLPAAVVAQTSMGGVSGTVSDSQGAVLPGATVTLTNTETNVTTVRHTNAEGFFAFVNVRPGAYTLTVEMQGLKTVQLEKFIVGVAETVTRNARLEVGQVTEVIQVRGSSSELIQTASATLGQVIEEKVIRDLPLQGRNFTALLLLTPGTNPVSTAQGPGANGGNETAVNSFEGNSGMPGGNLFNASIQGQQNRSKIYYMDGIVNTSVRAGTYVALPDIDSLQEFKVQSQSDKAEFGGVLGGVVNMTSKSGGNRFAGSAFGMGRSEKLAARNPFRDFNRTDGSHPKFRQGQFGANVGGPIVRNKTFFFGSYDGWRFSDVTNVRASVPAARELDGDFSQTFHGRQIFNPFTTRVVNGVTIRDPFPGNIIPPELISPTMQAFLKAYMVKPNLPGNVANNYNSDRSQENNSNSFQARVDHHFSNSDNVFFRWTERRINAFIPRGDRGFIEPDSINRNVGGGWFHSFNSNLVVELRGGLATQPTEDAPTQHELGVEPQQGLQLPELDRFFGYAVDQISTVWTGMPELGVRGPRPRGNPNWNAAADMSWLRGKHNLKGGFQMLQINRLQKNQFGLMSYTAEATRNPQSTGNTGDPIASALLGLPSRIQGFVHDIGYIDFKTSTISGYVQDTWAIRRNITLNYGLRYDYVTRALPDGDFLFQSGPDMDTGEWIIALPETPPVCTGQAPPCLPSPLNTIPANEFIRITGDRNSLLKPIKDNWGPRAGVAWQINDRMVLRTGYALMWDSMVGRSQYGQHQFETWGWPQFSGIDTGSINVQGGPITRLEDTETLPFGVPRAAPWNSEGFYNDPDRKNAYSHQYHTELQRQITNNLMVGAAYVGSRNGRMEYAGRPQALREPGIEPGTGRRYTLAELNARRPWPHITGIFTYSDDIGMSQYDSLQIKAQQRFSDGLSSILSYTYSRTIDTSSGWFNAENGIGGGATVQNYHDIEGNKGRSSYDIPHIFTWGTVWELPFGHEKRWLNQGPVSWILGDWQLNWFLIARSGQPFNVTAGGDPANVGFTGYSRANQVGDPHENAGTVDRWINPAAFAVPVNSFGNYERNSLRAPSFWNVDVGLQRNFPVGDRTLQFRIEAFNVFNHINWGNPAVDASNPATLGRITTMNGRPRQIQFGARMLF